MKKKELQNCTNNAQKRYNMQYYNDLYVRFIKKNFQFYENVCDLVINIVQIFPY